MFGSPSQRSLPGKINPFLLRIREVRLSHVRQGEREKMGAGSEDGPVPAQGVRIGQSPVIDS